MHACIHKINIVFKEMLKREHTLQGKGFDVYFNLDVKVMIVEDRGGLQVLVLYIHMNVGLIKESVVLVGQDNAEGADRQTFEGGFFVAESNVEAPEIYSQITSKQKNKS